MKKTQEGYVDLSANIPNWNKARQKAKVIPSTRCGPYYQGWWIKNLDEEDWFLKVFYQKGIPYRFYVELLLEQLAQIVGIRSIDSKIVEVNKSQKIYGLISKDFRKKSCDIVSGKEIVLDFLENLEKRNKLEEYLGIKNLEDLNTATSEFNSLDCIWDSLQYRYYKIQNGNEIVMNIMTELAKRYTFLFLMMQSDFHLGNWEIIETQNNAYLTPMYDMDMSFRSSFLNSSQNNSMKSFLSKSTDVYEDFSRFYYSLPEKDQLLIENEIAVLTPEIISTTINLMPQLYCIEMPQEMKNKILERYSKHYQKMKEEILIKRSR